MNGRTSVSLQYHVFGTKEIQSIPITEDMISRFEMIFVYWDSTLGLQLDPTVNQYNHRLVRWLKYSELPTFITWYKAFFGSVPSRTLSLPHLCWEPCPTY